MAKNSRSLKWNLVANYIGLAYSTLIGIAILPTYLGYLGAEAFGLIGFFVLLQSVMQLFDAGMSPLLARQAASARGKNEGYLELGKLLRSLEFIALALALVIGFCVALGSGWIASTWLNVTSLEPGSVIKSLILMGTMIGFRLLGSLYRSGIQGMENQIQLNVSNVAIATLRYVGAFLLLKFVTRDIVQFFIYQFFVTAAEVLVLRGLLLRLLASEERPGFGFYWSTLRPLLPFSFAVAYTAGISVLLTNSDKLVLSSTLSLTEYGYFALVGVISTGLMQISGPLSQAILPRMTFLVSQGKEHDLRELYRRATELMAVIVFPLVGVTALFSTELLFAWTSNEAASTWAGPILFWFALGAGIMSVGAFQYYLQFARGSLRMHVAYNSVSAFVQIPIVVIAALTYGAMGVAVAWFSLRLITFIFWVPFVHRRFAPGIHIPWLVKDIAPIFLSTSVLLLASLNFSPDFQTMNRLEIFSILICIGFVVVLVNLLVSRVGRKFCVKLVRRG